MIQGSLDAAMRSRITSVELAINGYKGAEKKLFLTSSFQTHSIPLLHIISTIDRTIPVYFLNTGFHFPETYTYVREVADLLDLNLHYLTSATPKSQQRDESGNFFFCSNPNRCCDINKVEPLEPILREYDIWITGVRKDQNHSRTKFDVEEHAPNNTMRYHPMLEWNSRMIYTYCNTYHLPPHPLEKQGYMSVGCEPCTEKFSQTDRKGRWTGQLKDECGLHTDLIVKE